MPVDHLYEYAVVRYVPRIEREEFVNVGLIMMCKRRRWLRVGIHLDSDRLRSIKAVHTEEELKRQLSMFTIVGEGCKEGGPMAAMAAEERFRWLTAVKSSCIQTSRPHPGLTEDLDGTFEDLFAQLVL